jgi:peptidoglycan hydrolase FlgJ
MEIHGLQRTGAEPKAMSSENPKLSSAAHEFEASMMKEFLKPLEHDSLFSNDGQAGDGDGEGSAGAIMSFGSQAMAKAISERGGFGIATLILNHFRTSSKEEQSTAVDSSADHSSAIHLEVARDTLRRAVAETSGAKVSNLSADEGP